MIVRTDDSHYTAIAAALRHQTGTQATYKPSQMADAVTALGQSCAHRHFVTTVTGNGQTVIRFHVPFAPDYLTVLCGDSDVYANADQVIYSVSFDLAAFGFLGGMAYTSVGGGVQGQLMTSASIHNRYSRAQDGTVTLQNIGTTVSSFFAGRPYTVIAVQYTQTGDKERITEYVRSLTGSGSATLNRAKVEAAFTAEEWAALAAEKPDWTFSFI